MNRFGLILAICLCVVAAGAGLSAPVQGADPSLALVLPVPGFSEGWVLEEAVALYDQEHLFDHINGEAELYFPYGFEALAAALYVSRADPQSAIAADVYRMGTPLDAFGIYSNYRRADAAPAPIGAGGFVSASQMMFYQDRYFVRLQATGPKGIQQDVFLACGRAISRNLPSNTKRPAELDVFGIPAVVPKTERYIAQSLLGYAFFRRGLTADALLGGERVQVFLVTEDSPEAARKAFVLYRSYLETEGRDVRVTEGRDRTSLAAADPLYGGVLAEWSGRYIIGAVRLKEVSAGRPLVEALRGRLGGARDQ